MPRRPLALGTWGELRTHVATTDAKGKPTSYRACAKYRDYDGVTRQVERHGKNKTAALNALRAALKERSIIGRRGELIGTDRFSVAAKLWMEALVEEGARSPGTVGTYQKHLTNHVLPALGELRLTEITTPLVDRFVGHIKKNVGVPTARACRSVVSGIMGLTVATARSCQILFAISTELKVRHRRNHAASRRMSGSH
jgi:hypothetical protein